MSEKPRDNAVLEHNLELLLRRAYVPALPRPEFRDGIVARARREADRLGRGRALEHVMETPARRWQHVAAAAAVLLAVLAGFLAVTADFRSPETRLTDAGAVALGFTGEWRAASPAELTDGLDLVSGALPVDAVLVATPEAASLVAHTPAASVRVDPGSVIRLDVVPRGTRVDVRRGSARRLAPDGASSGDVVLEQGTLTVLRPLRANDVAATEDAGANDTPQDGGTDVRRPVEGAEGSTPDEPVAIELPRGALVLRVLDAAEGEELHRFDLLLLPDDDDPEPEEPEVLPFGADPNTPEARVDEHYVTDVLPRGRYRVFVQAEGFAMYHGPSLELGGEVPAPQLRVDLVRGGTVRGWIVDRATGNPIPDAWVLSETDAPTNALPFRLDGWQSPRIPDWMRASTVAGADGRFTLEHLSPGSHVLRVSRPGYAPTWTDPVAVVDGEVRDDVDVVLGPGGSITGTVTAEDGSPLLGAFLIVMPVSMTSSSRPLHFSIAGTDAAGTYLFEDLPAGMLMVMKWDSDRAAQTGVQPVLRPSIVSPPGEGRVDFLGHEVGVRLEGVFRDRAGRPLPGEKLSLLPQDAVAEDAGIDFQATATDDQGRFALLLPRPGTYLIYRTHGMGERLTLCEAIEVPDVQLHTIDVRAWGGTLEGTLRAQDTGDAIPDGVVVVSSVDSEGSTLMAGRAIAAADGTWALTGLRGGRYVVHGGSLSGSHAEVRADEVELVEAVPDEDLPVARVDLDLPPGGGVEVILLDADGASVPPLDIDVFDLAGRPLILAAEPVPGVGGRSLLRGLAPGSYRIRAEAAGGLGGDTTVRVIPAETTTATIRLTSPDNR